MSKGIRLREPIRVSTEDVERTLVERVRDECAASLSSESFRGTVAARAADQLNRTLDLNAFDLLAQGWAKVPAVRNAVQLSVLKPGPPGIVRLDEHTIASTSYPILEVHVGPDPWPELRLTLEIVVRVQTATLAAREGRIELVALGKAPLIARLKYNNALLKEHATTVEGVLKDPFRHQPAASDRRKRVDIAI